MKLLSAFFLALLFVVFGSSVSSAKLATSPAETKRLEIKNTLQDKREDLQEKRASLEGKVADKRNENIASIWLKSKSTIVAVIDRLNKLIERIEARIARIDESGGGSTVRAKSEVQKAKNLIVEANKMIANIDAKLPEILSSERPKDSFWMLLRDIKAIRKNLMEAHKSLANIIGSIKGLRVGEDKLSGKVSVTASPTKTPSPTVTVTVTLTPTP